MPVISEGRFVVMGGASQVGATIGEQLLAAGACEVVLLDNLSLGLTETMQPMLSDPRCTFVRGDVALAAKAITTLDRDWEVLDYKGGLVDGEVLEADQFLAIARLPGRDALNAQFAGVVASPLTGLVRGLGSMISGLAIQLQAMADQGLVSGEAPPEEAPPEEDAA